MTEIVLASIGVVLLIGGLCIAWILTLIGMPGNWVIVLLAAAFGWFVPAGWRIDLGWQALVTLIGLAVMGELLELAASAFGTNRAGGSRRAAVMAVIGSVAGGLLGLTAGLPLPPIGPVIGVLLFAAIGAAVGAMLGEDWAGRELDQSLKVGKAAFWGRLWGTFGKVALGSTMVVIVLLALVVR